jgi:signal transduction histidine kinase
VADRVVDVLELELAGRRLTAANEQLAASNERLADFAGQVSHDLKNPLTAVAMSLEMAREEADDVPDLAGTPLVSLLERASRGADRMQGMIDDMLAYARGGGEPQLEPVDLAAVMAAVADDLAGDLADGQLDVEELPVVVGDPVQLRLVLQNLVANGLKFTREGEPPQVRVSARRTTSGWRVEVADHGRGVAAEERERVFEPFVRLDKRVPGTGVGLATCRRVLVAHGGRTGLDEAPGGGTLAWFELPDLPDDDPA